MKIYIYTICFPISGKYYIGQTDNLKRRMFDHLNTDSVVGRALQKYDDWQVTILHTVKTCDEANRIEIEEIRNFNSVVPNGYNRTRGGNDPPVMRGKDNPMFGRKRPDTIERNIKGRGRKCPSHSKFMQENNPAKRPEVKKKLSERMQGNKHLEGHKHSEETIKKMREAAKNPTTKYKRLKSWVKRLEDELEQGVG